MFEQQEYIYFSIRILCAIILTISSIPFSRFVSRKIKSAIKNNTKNSKDSNQKNMIYLDLTTSILRYTILFVAIITSLKIIYIDTTVIFGTLGVFGLGLSLAFQDYMKDFVSGLFLIFFDYFRTGDIIRVTLPGEKDILAQIHEFRFFSTTVTEKENVFSEIPNSQLWSSSFTNITREKTTNLSFKINISNKNNLKDVTNILKHFLARHELSKEKNPNNISIIFENDKYKGNGTILECRVPVISQTYLTSFEIIPRDTRYELQKHSFLVNDNSFTSYPHTQSDIQYKSAFITPIIEEDTHYE